MVACGHAPTESQLCLVSSNIYQLGQNIGLFLVALMDHWVSVVMSFRLPHSSPYSGDRARYGVGLCLLYFLFSAIAVDMTLQKYWTETDKLSDERLVDLGHAQMVRKKWNQYVFSLTPTCSLLTIL